jgi:hypothetical protein
VLIAAETTCGVVSDHGIKRFLEVLNIGCPHYPLMAYGRKVQKKHHFSHVAENPDPIGFGSL